MKWENRRKEMEERGDPGPPKRVSIKSRREIQKELDNLYYGSDGYVKPRKPEPDWLIRMIGYTRSR